MSINNWLQRTTETPREDKKRKTNVNAVTKLAKDSRAKSFWPNVNVNKVGLKWEQRYDSWRDFCLVFWIKTEPE